MRQMKCTVVKIEKAFFLIQINDLVDFKMKIVASLLDKGIE